MSQDMCAICAGIQGPDHRHLCDRCGKDAGSSALVAGHDGVENTFYCDAYCMGDPADEVVGLVQAARAIRHQLAEAGIPWEAV